MKELQETYVSQQTDTSGRNWVKGDFCAVRYTTDNKWYRARVQEQSEDRQKVQVKSPIVTSSCLITTNLH